MSVTNTQNKNSLIFCIHSGSIIATYSNNETSIVVSNFLKSHRIKNTDDYLQEMLRVIGEISMSLIKKITSNGFSLPSVIEVVYSNPWITTYVDTVAIENSQSQKYKDSDRDSLEELIDSNCAKYTQLNEVSICDVAILGVYMNGYAIDTHADKNKLSYTKLEGRCIFSIMDTDVMQEIENILASYFMERKVRHMCFANYMQTIINSEKTSYTGIVGFIGCEMSECLVFKDGILTESVDLANSGTHTMITEPYRNRSLININLFRDNFFKELRGASSNTLRDSIIILTEDSLLKPIITKSFLEMGNKLSELRSSRKISSIL